MRCRSKIAPGLQAPIAKLSRVSFSPSPSSRGPGLPYAAHNGSWAVYQRSPDTHVSAFAGQQV